MPILIAYDKLRSLIFVFDDSCGELHGHLIMDDLSTVSHKKGATVKMAEDTLSKDGTYHIRVAVATWRTDIDDHLQPLKNFGVVYLPGMQRSGG